jgi:uracil-DNA glycosylase
MPKPARLLTNIDTLHQLQEDIEGCRACPRLVAWREQIAVDKRASFRDDTYWGRPVSGFGDPAAHVLVLGLAPAAHGANRTGRVFTGDRSGDWLYRAMYKAGFANQPNSTDRNDGLALTNAWVSAAVRCAPPDNKPSIEERDQCRSFFQRETSLLPNVNVIVALGKFAYDVALKEFDARSKPKFGHGVEVAIEGDSNSVAASGQRTSTKRSLGLARQRLTIVCSFHPSQQNTFTGKLTEPMIDAVFARARDLAFSKDSDNSFARDFDTDFDRDSTDT